MATGWRTSDDLLRQFHHLRGFWYPSSRHSALVVRQALTLPPLCLRPDRLRSLSTLPQPRLSPSSLCVHTDVSGLLQLIFRFFSCFHPLLFTYLPHQYHFFCGASPGGFLQKVFQPLGSPTHSEALLNRLLSNNNIGQMWWDVKSWALVSSWLAFWYGTLTTCESPSFFVLACLVTPYV